MDKLRTFRKGKIKGYLVTEGPLPAWHENAISSLEELEEFYGGRPVCANVDPEFEALLMSAPELARIGAMLSGILMRNLMTVAFMFSSADQAMIHEMSESVKGLLKRIGADA